MVTHCPQVLVQKCACVLRSFTWHIFVEWSPCARPCGGTGNAAVNEAASPRLVYILLKYLHAHTMMYVDAEPARFFHARGSQKDWSQQFQATGSKGMWRPLMQINQVTRKVIFKTTNPWLSETLVGKGELPTHFLKRKALLWRCLEFLGERGVWAKGPAGPWTASTCWIWGQPQGQGVLGRLEERERDHKRQPGLSRQRWSAG